MRPTRARSPFHLHAICCLLSYALAATLLALPGRGVEASPGTARGTSKATSSSPVRKAQADAPRREGELLVRFRADFSEQGKDDVARGHGARRMGKLRGDSRLEKLELRPNEDPQAVAEQLRGRPEVELAEPNFLIKHEQVTPNDSRFSEQWALQNTGQSGGVSGSDIGAAWAWQKTTGSLSTVIAVVDSGIDFTHRDLVGNEWANDREKPNGKDDDRDGYTDDLHGWDWVTDSSVIRDEHGHGGRGRYRGAGQQRRRHLRRDVAGLSDEPARARLDGHGRHRLGRRGDRLRRRPRGLGHQLLVGHGRRVARTQRRHQPRRPTRRCRSHFSRQRRHRS